MACFAEFFHEGVPMLGIENRQGHHSEVGARFDFGVVLFDFVVEVVGDTELDGDADGKICCAVKSFLRGRPKPDLGVLSTLIALTESNFAIRRWFPG